jgi:hypothetical protein
MTELRTKVKMCDFMEPLALLYRLFIDFYIMKFIGITFYNVWCTNLNVNILCLQ